MMTEIQAALFKQSQKRVPKSKSTYTKPAMNLPVLLVDDDISILVGLKRRLRSKFQIMAAPDADAALKLMETQGPFSVIVSDMRMPGMNGVEFLAKAQAISPMTTRILLTGDQTLETAMSAINEGRIFQLVHKPCSGDELGEIIREGVETYIGRTDQERFATNWADAVQEDLSAPLRQIVEFAGFIENGGVPNSEIRKYASFVRERGDALMHVTKTMTDLSSIRSDRRKLNLKSISYQILCEILQSELAQFARTHGVDIKFYTDDPSQHLVADTHFLVTALHSITSDIITKTQKDGCVCVQIYSSRAKGQEHVFEVSNQMPHSASHVERLVPFGVISEATANESVSHTALAMPMASAIIEVHKGNLTLTETHAGPISAIITLPNYRDEFMPEGCWVV